MTLARSERAGLAASLLAGGPGAPTLCAGWLAADLAAHVVLRERRPDAAPGIVVRPLAGWTRRVQRRYADRPFDELVGLVRSGPPRWSPLGWPAVDAAANGVELFLHHEDVRRAAPGWEPRTLPAADVSELWGRLPRLARLAMRGVAGGVVLRRPSGEAVTVRVGSPRVTVVGEPAELVLFATGRQRAARVELDGGAAAVEALRQTAFGL